MNCKVRYHNYPQEIITFPASFPFQDVSDAWDTLPTEEADLNYINWYYSWRKQERMISAKCDTNTSIFFIFIPFHLCICLLYKYA